MIKNSTISNNKAMKILPIAYNKLLVKLQEALELIKEANITLDQLKTEMKEKDLEIAKLKSHWIYRATNFFKW